MNSRFAVVAAVALGAGVVGFFAGRKTVSSPSPANVSSQNSIEATAVRPKTASPANAERAVAKFDAADFEARLKKFKSLTWRRRWDQLRDLARSVSSGDETNALALAEKNLPYQEWMNFRYGLIEFWAERSPKEVLAYGQGLKNRGERQNAISQALTGWARQEPDAALAWAEKQPHRGGA